MSDVRKTQGKLRRSSHFKSCLEQHGFQLGSNKPEGVGGPGPTGVWGDGPVERKAKEGNRCLAGFLMGCP